MADNPFVVKGDEWGYCRKYRTHCMKAWSDGSCISKTCDKFPDRERETKEEEK